MFYSLLRIFHIYLNSSSCPVLRIFYQLIYFLHIIHSSSTHVQREHLQLSGEGVRTDCENKSFLIEFNSWGADTRIRECFSYELGLLSTQLLSSEDNGRIRECVSGLKPHSASSLHLPSSLPFSQTVTRCHT